MTTKSLVYGTETSLVDAIAKWVKSLAVATKQRRAYNKIIRELSALTPRELSDIGVSPWTIRETAQFAVYGNRS
jgi:uncharacterized protein YjiS (DUF1127 family)